MTARSLEAAFIALIAFAVLVGGGALLQAIAQFRGIAVWVLAAIAAAIVSAFRHNYRSGGAGARVYAARDAAFLAAIAGAIAFVFAPARWSLGSTIVALEIALVIEFLTRITPVP